MAPEDSPFCVAPVPVPMAGVAVAPKPVIPVLEDPPDPRPPAWLELDEPEEPPALDKLEPSGGDAPTFDRGEVSGPELLLPKTLPGKLAAIVPVAEAAEPDSRLPETELLLSALGLGVLVLPPALIDGVAGVPLPTVLDDPLELPPLPALPLEFPLPPLPLLLPPPGPLPFPELPPLLPPGVEVLAVAEGVADGLLELPPLVPLLLLPEDPPRREPRSEPTTEVRL